ncbi:hypothetical protein Mal52_23080 [Symmachiella dynata]|uniref:Uncharacterized protein n=1 Tax=Symmachiella dynata TaxID=2527995 RepID=A0A517ZMZ7_9PLAN|nr:hypothetical protein Mal52_23080 [Symmachiella dynata]
MFWMGMDHKNKKRLRRSFALPGRVMSIERPTCNELPLRHVMHSMTDTSYEHLGHWNGHHRNRADWTYDRTAW